MDAVIAIVLVAAFIELRNDSWRDQHDSYSAQCVAFRLGHGYPQKFRYMQQFYIQSITSGVATRCAAGASHRGQRPSGAQLGLLLWVPGGLGP